jgi:hypothetical protein
VSFGGPSLSCPNLNNGSKGKCKGKGKGKGKNNDSSGTGNNNGDNSRDTPAWPSFYNF